MANGAAQDERIGHIFHFDRCLYARLNAHLLKRAAEGERVDHGCEHAHVISGRAVHAAVRRGEAAPNISATDDDGSLHPEVVHFLDADGDFPDNCRRNVVSPAALLHRLAA